MLIKLIGAAMLFACGGYYSKTAREKAEKELSEVEFALSLIVRIKSEIADYGVPLGEILKSAGVNGGSEGVLRELTCEKVKECLCDLNLIGRGYGKEEMRICDKIAEGLGALKKETEARVREVTAISRVKGYGVAAAAVILLL